MESFKIWQRRSVRGAHASSSGSCRSVAPENSVRRDAEHHTRDAYAPRTLRRALEMICESVSSVVIIAVGIELRKLV